MVTVVVVAVGERRGGAVGEIIAMVVAVEVAVAAAASMAMEMQGAARWRR